MATAKAKHRRSDTARTGGGVSLAPAARAPGQTPALDRFDLYECCVQSPEYDARMLAAMHAGTGRRQPRAIAEDFCGTAALARAWIDIDPKRHTATVTDHDRQTIERAIGASARRSPGNPSLNDRPRPSIRFVCADVRSVHDKADILSIQNYSIGELHHRNELDAYFAHARSRLLKGGILVCDTYGGLDALLTGSTERTIAHPLGHSIRYTWEQRSADPLTAMVSNAIHFRVGPGRAGKATRSTGNTLDLLDAFVYHWRLWTVPELRESLLDAGFRSAQVYARQADAVDQSGLLHALPITDPDELPESFNCYVVGRL